MLRTLLSPRSAAIAFGLYALVVVACTTWPFDFQLEADAVRAKWAQTEWNLVYHDAQGRLLIDHDLVLNLLFLVPLGVAWAFVAPARGWWVAALGALVVGLLLSVFVEGLQVLTPDRSTQVADVWRNALGAGLAGGAAAALRPSVMRWVEPRQPDR